MSLTSPTEVPPYLLRTESPIGRIELWSDGESITGLSIERAGHLPFEGLPEAGNTVLKQAVRELDEYFSGTRRSFDVPVSLKGTPFQQSVWHHLAALPWGEVTSYGAVGVLTGRPTAGRAVGGAVGANPVPIIVPCHRILASNRRITGYSAGEGIPTKAWLLALEGIEHSV